MQRCSCRCRPHRIAWFCWALLWVLSQRLDIQMPQTFCGLSLGCGRRLRSRYTLEAVGAEVADLTKLQKRELLELLRSYNVEAGGMTKSAVIEKIRAFQASQPDAPPSGPPPDVSQREVAEIAMDDWQNATTVGFDCKTGRHADDGVEFDIIGPGGQVEHRARFSLSWPPTCTCPEAQEWGSRQRCKHVCMILVKCGVPYAAVSDSNWDPDEMEVKSIVEHMKGKWSPIPLEGS
mmetsp:Transcript_13968/g.26077  ORF Transcript_13968/g.26077 Transcript_13968/m.26077 type:complete len:234 (-) Transcript_13968:33-734(-)